MLRAVNVGGTGKLPMTGLRAMCEECGFKDVRTYIASGNVVFKADLDEAAVQAKLEAALQGYAGKPVGVVVRTGAEMAAVLAANPFAAAAPNRTVAIFLSAAPPVDLLDKVTGQVREEIVAGLREIYVHYPDGQADTKLKISAASSGTARNMNTVAKLAELAA
ncbi:MAG: DUF1697 domain-containing protein [Stellaceae bacterium]